MRIEMNIYVRNKEDKEKRIRDFPRSRIGLLIVLLEQAIYCEKSFGYKEPIKRSNGD